MFLHYFNFKIDTFIYNRYNIKFDKKFEKNYYLY